MRDPDADTVTAFPVDELAVGRLTRRAQFVLAAGGRRWHGKALSLQACARVDDGTIDDVRIGFTLTKKVGNAVVRNRARRRLKEAVRLASALPVVRGHDYVIVGRLAAIRLPFAALTAELSRGLVAVHTGRRSEADAPRKPRGTPPTSSDPRRETAEPTDNRPKDRGVRRRGAKRIRPAP